MAAYCSQWFKDTNLKANHNCSWYRVSPGCIVPNGSKILIWKQITTYWCYHYFVCNCSQWFKDTNLKANHNSFTLACFWPVIVPNGSKILIWKQITTVTEKYQLLTNCSQWFKDTNLKANHNHLLQYSSNPLIVPNGSKILIWKQITTEKALYWAITDCSQWFKDTNLKANHNSWRYYDSVCSIVPNGSKILIWKQITTHN